MPPETCINVHPHYEKPLCENINLR